ncbi:Na+/H+ antiporter NhaC family protein [Blautia schinkii]|nr:Na+/H+ antiporter NhaC family protein [Blautia schinkii]
MNGEENKKYGAKALIPIGVFLVLYVGCGVFFTLQGVEKPFNVMPRYVAVMAGILVGLIFFERDKKLADKAEIYYHSAGAPGVMTLSLIVLLAGGFAGSCAAIGGKDSMVNLGASLIPPQLLIPGIFAMCAIVSTCIGTSMGTVSVMAPVAVALAQGTGVNLGVAAAAVLTGATFGDNLSMISDTTICATKGVGAEMKDKFRMNFLIAIPAAVLACVVYGIVGLNSGASQMAEIGEYNLVTIIPYIAVLVMAVAGLDVILVLTIGMGLSCVIGLFAGTATVFEWAQGIGSGMEGMFWLAVFAMMISGMIGLVRHYGGIDWLVGVAKKGIKSRKSCEYIIGLFPTVLSGIIANNVLAIIINAPIANELGGRYKIAPKRLASLLDIGACLGAMIVPHGTCMLMVQEAAGCDYLDVLKYEFYPLFLLIAVVVTIQFGLLRTKEEKG